MNETELDRLNNQLVHASFKIADLVKQVKALEAENAALREFYELTTEYATMPAQTLPYIEVIVRKIVALKAGKP